MEPRHGAVAIIPCNDLDESQAFYERLGFEATSVYPAQGYRIMHDASGATIHLTAVEPGWVVAERNAHGLYFYSKDVDALAAALGTRAEVKPWRVREFAVSDPNGLQVRIGWPIG